MVFFCNFSSAELLTFDNVKSYDSVTREVTIKNTFGLGADLAKVKLNTPLDNKVGIGYVQVAEFEVTSYEDYKNLISSMDFYNIRTGMSKIELDFDYKYKSYENYEVNDYEKVLSTTLKNGTEIYDYKIVGTHTEQREIWLPLEKLDYIKGDILTIGIWTTTYQGQKVEWIPTIAGLKINEFATWTADLNTGLISYYKFEGDYVDSVNVSSPLTNYGTLNSSGIIGSGIDTTGTKFANRTFGAIPTGANAVSVCLWDYRTDSSNSAMFGYGSASVTSGTTFVLASYTQKYSLVGYYVDITDSATYSLNTWNFVCGIQVNGTLRQLYVNGINKANSTGPFNIGTTMNPYVGLNLQNPQNHIGKIDEVGIWNRSLTNIEIEQLYNGGLGMTYTTIFGSSVTLNSPADALTSKNQTILFNATIGALEPTNVSLIIDSTINTTNTSSILGDYLFTKILNDGVHTWNVQACMSTGVCNNGTQRTLTINTTPYIAFITPPTLVNYANITQEYIPMKVNVSTSVFKNITYYLENVNGTSFTQYYETETYDINFTNIPDAHYHYNVTVCTTTNKCNSTETRHVNHDTAPPVISITSPLSQYSYIKVGQAINLNFTASEIGLGNISSCWWNYNGTNYSIACTNATLASANFYQEVNDFNITAYANDTFGNIGSAFTSWSFNIFEDDVNYTESVYITSSDVISSNITYTAASWSNIEAYLVYNGTSYLTTKKGTGNSLKFSKTVDVPNYPGENVSFYFYYNLLNSTGTYVYNSSTYEQSVVSILIAPCDDVTTTLALNFTLLEEGNNNLLNGSMEANFQYRISSGNGVSFINLTYSNITDEFSNYRFCISPATVNFTIDGTFSYYKAGYDRREYFFNDFIINNVTDNINLFLSQTALTDIFTFKVQDQNQDPVEGAIVYVERWDIGTNTFSTVGMVLTSSDGNGIINLRLNDAWYRYTVIYNGITYLTTDPTKESTTSRTLSISLGEDNPWNDFNGVQYSLTHSNVTNITLLTFADPTGAVNPGCLRILNITSTKTTSVFYSCVASTGGTVSYFIDSPGSYVAQAIFYLSDGTYKISDQLPFRVGTPDKYEKMRGKGYFISMMLIGTAAMVGVAAGSIILGIVAIVGALFAVNMFGWLDLTGTVLYGLISVLILIAITASRRNNQ